MKPSCHRPRLGIVFVLLLVLNACTSSDDGGRTAGSAVVLLDAGFAGAWPTGLDPATSTTARANLSIMNAIYGGLFQLSEGPEPNNFVVTGVLARGYELTEGGRTLVIHLRDNVVFSDGSPFDASAVRRSMERNLESLCTCAPRDWPWVEQNRITAPDERTVVLHFSKPFAAAINVFPVSNMNWIASPTAVETLGLDQFKITPVGAGPFRVKDNQLSSRLVLERNPLYWDHGRPLLDRLVFLPIGSEQAAYQALLAGDAHVYEGMTLPAVIQLAQKSERLRVTLQPATSPYVIQLNTRHAPFNDHRAREAIYYATDVNAIRKGIFNDWYPATQSFTGTGGLFHEASVPGYRTFDRQRAEALVREIGGLHVELATLRTPVAEQLVTALQTQWRAAGIDVSIRLYELPSLIRAFQSSAWQATLSVVGSYDPEAGSGVGLRFRSDGTYSGVSDPELDQLLYNAGGAQDPEQRHELYVAAARHISDNAYGPFILAFAPAQVAVQEIQGPGLTTQIPPILVSTGILWQDVAMSAE